MSHPSIPRYHCPPDSESPWGTRLWRGAICTLNLRLSSMAELLVARSLWRTSPLTRYSIPQAIWPCGPGPVEKLPADYWPLLICAAGFPGGSDSKESACNSGDPSLIPGLERSPGEGNGHSLHYSCLKNSSDRRAWWATVLGVARIRQDWLTNTHTDTQFAMLWKLFTILPIHVRQYHEGFSLSSIHTREIGGRFPWWRSHSLQRSVSIVTWISEA